jgi:disulfide bond formation protein DsbB
MSRLDPILARWPLLALLIAASMLAVAHAFQSFGHLAPCHLCLKQREAYWAALVPAALGSGLLLTRHRELGRRVTGAVLALIFAYGAYLAAFHAGAEWHWWRAPESCASTGAKVSLADLKALMGGASAPPPACDVAPWRLLGLSMAGWNFLVSLGLVAASAFSTLPSRRAP